MLDKVMVFDNEKQLIGWAPADCNRVPKSRDASIWSQKIPGPLNLYLLSSDGSYCPTV